MQYEKLRNSIDLLVLVFLAGGQQQPHGVCQPPAPGHEAGRIVTRPPPQRHLEPGPSLILHTGHSVELETKVREDFTIAEKGLLLIERAH